MFINSSFSNGCFQENLRENSDFIRNKRMIDELEENKEGQDSEKVEQVKKQQLVAINQEASSQQSQHVCSTTRSKMSKLKVKKNAFTDSQHNRVMTFFPALQQMPNPFVQVQILVPDAEGKIHPYPIHAKSLQEISLKYKDLLSSNSKWGKNIFEWVGEDETDDGSIPHYYHPNAVAQVILFGYTQGGEYRSDQYVPISQSLANLEGKEKLRFLEDILRICHSCQIRDLPEECKKVILEEMEKDLEFFSSCYTLIFSLPYDLSHDYQLDSLWRQALDKYSRDPQQIEQIADLICQFRRQDFSSLPKEKQGNLENILKISFDRIVEGLLQKPTLDNSTLENICEALLQFYPTLNVPCDWVRKFLKLQQFASLDSLLNAQMPATLIFKLFFEDTLLPEDYTEAAQMLNEAQVYPEFACLFLANAQAIEYPTIENKLFDRAIELNLKRMVCILYFKAQFIQDDLDQKIAILDLLLDLDPFYKFALVERGILLLVKGVHEKAFDDFNKALEIDAYYAHALLSRSKYYRRYKNQPDLALKDIEAYLKLRSDDTKALAIKAECCYLKKQFSEALDFANQSLQLDNKSALSLTIRGKIYFDQNQFLQAAADFDEVLKLKSRSFEALKGKGRSLWKQGLFDQAIIYLDRALEIKPTDYIALAVRGECKQKQNLMDAALADLTAAIELQPNDTFALLKRVDCYLNTNQLDKAKIDLDKLFSLNLNEPLYIECVAKRANYHYQLKKFNLALEDLFICGKYDFHNSARLTHVGICYWQMNHLNEAKKYFDLALNISPTDVHILSYRAQCSLSIYSQFKQQNDLNEALKYSNQALNLDPQNCNSLEVRMTCYQYNQMWDEAFADATQLLNMGIRKDSIFQIRGLSFQNKRLWNEAIQDFNQALIMNPHLIDTLKQRAICYQQVENFQLAAKDYEALMQTLPSHKNDRLFYLENLARCYLKMDGHSKQALSMAIQASEIGKKPDLFLLKAACWLKVNRKDNKEMAIKALDHVLKLQPTNLEALMKKAELHQQQGQFDRILEMWDRALQSNPYNLDIITKKIDFYLQAGQIEERLHQLNALLEAQPQNVIALFEKAHCNIKLNLPLQAFDDFNTILLINPQHAAALQAKNQLIAENEMVRNFSELNFSTDFEIVPDINFDDVDLFNPS